MPFRKYLAEIKKNLARGDATELTHRNALQELFHALGAGKKIRTTNEASYKTEKVGRPDILVYRDEKGGGLPVGVVETKNIGADLPKVEKGEQLRRYLDAFPNLLLTDYLEFRRFTDGALRETASLGGARGGKVAPEAGGEAKVEALVRNFLLHDAPWPANPQDLARRMAHYAHAMHDVIPRILKGAEEEGEARMLLEQWEEFRQDLIPTLTQEEFADMYAQTLVYGLFAAKLTEPDRRPFTRAIARDLIPKTNPFLRKLFDRVAGADMPEGLGFWLDRLAELLDHSDMHAVLRDFGRKTRQEDPVVHFYESFLAAYNPKLRELRGVYYTPEPVVDFIVRAVDGVLKEKFKRPDGLADVNTLILDPAAGTASFLHRAITEIHGHVVETKKQKGAWSDYVSKRLLRRIFGFELLMAPYAVAHLKLGRLLQETGYDFQSDERLGVYLTNTLDEGIEKARTLGYFGFVAEENNAAAKIKNEEKIEVIIGNPPYSGLSANTNEWTERLLKKNDVNGVMVQSYYESDGAPLGERKLWLQDDYVKFIRFAQWRIAKTGRGVLGFISNHSWLDNPTFRGMRQSLMRTFDEIYILDLHGNAKKKEKCPDGSKDENVFDIMQGVAIAIFVKYASPPTPSPAEERGQEGRGEAVSPLPGGRGDGRGEDIAGEGGQGDEEWKEPVRTTRTLVEMARELRKTQTPAEDILWECLRNRRFSGWKFKRQHPLKKFIPDFYCHEAKLAIELDGGIHDKKDHKEYDKLRDETIKSLGISVLRIRNEELTEDMEGALAKIASALDRAPSPGTERGSGGEVFHAGLWGSREKKYESLLRADLKNLEWRELEPNRPHYFFIPRDEENRGEYEEGWKVTDIFPVNVTGIVTARDEFVIDDERKEIEKRIETFLDKSLSDDEVKKTLKLTENYAWRVREARKQLAEEKDWKEFFGKILYRPFDIKDIIYHPSVVWRTRDKVMRHMLAGQNLGLITCRQQSQRELPWGLVGVTKQIIEGCAVSNKTKEINYLFPLYLYEGGVFASPPTPSPAEERGQVSPLPGGRGDGRGEVRRPNLNPDFVKQVEERVGTATPEDIFHYIYAVLHSPEYRRRYAEFLKIDFPRVPVTSDKKLFFDLAALGERLVKLHLMESRELADPALLPSYPVAGSGEVEKVRYDENKKRVYINMKQYFEGIAEEVWNFHVGGYQVLQKWLKDRKGRALSHADIEHYQHIAVALAKTMEVMKAIDARIGKWPLA